MKKKYDFNKETDKDFLRAAGSMLQDKVLELELVVVQLQLEKYQDEEIKSKLTGQLLVLRRRIFDSKQEKKEKLKDLKKNKKKDKVNLIHNTNENKDDLEASENQEIKLFSDEVEHKIDSSICPKCGKDSLEELNNLFEESTEYDVNYAYYILKRHKRKKYKCRCCSKMVTAKGGPKLTPGGKFSIQMAAKIACDKFQFHLPLDRQRVILKKNGVDVSVKTLFSITDHLYSLLYPLNELNRIDVISGQYIGVDESPMPFYNPSKSSGYVWSMSNEIGAYYQFEPTRSGKVAREMIEGFSGVVITDGYQGYNFLDKMEGIVHAFCWSHMRRYFYDAMLDDDNAGTIIDYIDDFYEVEHNSESFKDLKHQREIRSSKIFDDLISWIEQNEGHYLNSTLTGKAINYFYNQREGLTHFLTNEYVPLDNNCSERRQRCPVMGRKNYLSFRSINGADVGMFCYSMIESCKTNGIEPNSYLIKMALRSIEGKELKSPYQYALELKAQITEKLKKELIEKSAENSS